jgi:CIC family chloride channel protein
LILLKQIKRVRNLLDKIKLYLEKNSFPEYTVFSIYAILIGAFAGLAAVLFHLSIEFFNRLFFNQTKDGLYFLGTAAVIILPAIGMFIQSLMIKLAPEISKSRGVLEIIKSVALKGGFIPFKTTLFHFLAPVICIGSGGTVGPEGPAAQLGGGVASKITTLFNFSDQRRKIFTAAGSGAAIAAIFNTPLGGVFFALEIILLNDFHAATFSALILSSVTASAISRIFLGNVSIFNFSTPEIGSYSNFYFFILLGLLSGIISVIFFKYNEFTSNYLKKKLINILPQWFLMIVVGLLVGVAGFYYHDIFGIGYSAINNILSNNTTWQVVAILFILKFLLVPLVLGSGGFGGTFAPALFLGACIGYLFSYFVSTLTGIPADRTTYILVGMGASLAGINSIPITAILMIFEMSRDYSIMLPLMLAVIISSTIVQIINKGTVHQKLLEKQGFHLTSGKETSVLKSIYVDEIMHTDIVTLNSNSHLNLVVSKLMESPYHKIYTVDDENNLIGVISETEIRPLITDYESLKNALIANDISRNKVYKISSDKDLEYALKLLSKQDIDELPVVNPMDDRKIIGTITRNDILSAYNRESIKHNLAEGLSREIQTLSETHLSKIADGYSIVEKKPNKELVGKNLSELRFRNRFGLEILMIKKSNDMFKENSEQDELVMPGPDYKIEEEDILVIFGKDENIQKTKEW